MSILFQTYTTSCWLDAYCLSWALRLREPFLSLNFRLKWVAFIWPPCDSNALWLKNSCRQHYTILHPITSTKTVSSLTVWTINITVWLLYRRIKKLEHFLMNAKGHEYSAGWNYDFQYVFSASDNRYKFLRIGPS